ncbi:hypothetical protein KP509_10G025600 [Ceratopteris richardii]|nr:hypothetical protein KP509_10G025600 [Ceratopteris richardii]
MAFAKCGAIEEAFQVSSVLPNRSSLSWTSIISAYADRGLIHEAIQVYRCMITDGVEPNNYTFVSLFKACGNSMDLERGKELFVEVKSKGLESDPFVSASLLTMYGQCGAVMEAETTFCEMPDRDIVSWNAMLSAYMRQGQPEMALRLFRQMQEEEFCGNHLTVVITLKACGQLIDKMKDSFKEGMLVNLICTDIAQGLHAYARKIGYESNILVRNILVTVYGKCGAIANAFAAFLSCPTHAVVSWNAMFSAHVRQCLPCTTLQMYKKMHEEGVNPDNLSFLLALQACDILIEEASLSAEGCVQLVQSLHTDLCCTDLGSDVIVGTSLLKLYARCGRMLEAEEVFETLPHRDVVTWTAMLSAYIEQELSSKALQMYEQMQLYEVSPNELTCVLALQACTALIGAEIENNRGNPATFVNLGYILHTDTTIRGFTCDKLVSTALLTMYGTSGFQLEADNVFNRMLQRDTVAWNVMLNAQKENGILLFREMEQEDVTLDDGTIVCLLNSSGRIGSLEATNWLHFAVVCDGCDEMSLVATALMDSYGRCGNMEDVDACFDGLLLWDLVLCCGYMRGYVGRGDAITSMSIMGLMNFAGYKPDDIVCALVLQSCSHAGCPSECLSCYCLMKQDQTVEINLKHYGILLDLFARAGDFKRVTSIIAKMPMQMDEAIWLSVLGACHLHRDVELANLALGHVVCLNLREIPAYVIHSNASTVHSSEYEV